MEINRNSGATFVLTLFALTAFASNSLLCRLALHSAPQDNPKIDPALFTSIRLLAGAAMLGILFSVRYWKSGRGIESNLGGNWYSALALFCYAAAFSFAYLRLTAGTGALILFGSVQATMFGWGLVQGARPRLNEWTGLGAALVGLAYLTAPGLSAPDPIGVVLMALAGISWGVYSLRGKGSKDPLAATTGNFILSLAFALPLATLGWSQSPLSISVPGVGLAIASGALASGVGYSVWYWALRGLSATHAAVVQLLVPVLTALGAKMLLGESFSIRLLISGTVILLGISLVVLYPKPRQSELNRTPPP